MYCRRSSNGGYRYTEESFTNEVDIATKISIGGRGKEKFTNSSNIVEEEIINSNNVADFSSKIQPMFNSTNCNIIV